MKIYVDGDACPKLAKELLYRTAERLSIDLIMVANQYLRTPPHPTISSIVVEQGADVADDKIVELCTEGDLVITADIPLAHRVIQKGSFALDPRGELYDAENIGNRLAVRDLLQDMRDSGMETGGPKSYSAQDRQAFAQALNQFTAQHYKK